MGYNQWIVIVLINRSHQPIEIKNVNLSWGKFYKDDDKDKEIPMTEIEGHIIPPKGTYQINSCGRLDLPSGTEGSFDLVDESGQIIRSFNWNCPWMGSTNQWDVTNPNEDWSVESSGANLGGGALGKITVEVVRVSSE